MKAEGERGKMQYETAKRVFNVLEALQQRLGGLHMLSTTERWQWEDAKRVIDANVKAVANG